jgi:hypothetical protein
MCCVIIGAGNLIAVLVYFSVGLFFGLFSDPDTDCCLVYNSNKIQLREKCRCYISNSDRIPNCEFVIWFLLFKD